jgi:HEPN/RES N-terminal domain 1/RES domain
MNLEKVCKIHFDDDCLQNYIIENGRVYECDICGNLENCIGIYEISEHIEECLKYEYDDPYLLGAHFDKEDNKYLFVNELSTDDILQDELRLENVVLYEAICQNIDNMNWAKRNIFGPTMHEFIKGGWDKFKEVVKYKIRFVFFDKINQENFENVDFEAMNPYHVLSEVGKTIEKLNLISTFIPHELKIFRGRQHDEKLKITNAKDLGAPPSKIAKANRMSPVGISMFYGAFDEYTCFQEIINTSWKNSLITFGIFSNSKELNLIDFTTIESVPSLFDIVNRDKRDLVKFIKDFVEDLSIPVKSDDSDHIEYIPTQIVAEYLKILFHNDKRIDGIIYNSVKSNAGKCVALFIGNNDCGDKFQESIQRSKSKNQDKIKKIYILTLDNANIIRKNVKNKKITVN